MNSKTIKLGERELTVSYTTSELEQFERYLSKEFGVHSIAAAISDEKNGIVTSRRLHISLIQYGLRGNHDDVKADEIREASPSAIMAAAMECINLVSMEMYPDEKKVETRAQTGTE